MPAHGNSLASISPDVKFVRNKLETVSLALTRDAGEINDVKGTVVQDISDCQKEFTAIEHLKLPAPWQYSQAWANTTDHTGDDNNVFAATDMVPYFNRHTTELDSRLNKYKSQLAEIEAHLRTVEGSAVEQMHKVMQRQASGDQERGQIAELASAMHVFEEAVLRVAGKVGETREGVIDCTLGRLQPNGSSRR
jgi:nucleoporin p58/p45